MIKQRTMVHIALNAKDERVGYLICAGGRLIPFSCDIKFNKYRNNSLSFWMSGFIAMPSVSRWKNYCKVVERAVRFQRVMLIGGAS